MSYVILLDAYQGTYDAAHYAVTDFGTKAYCEAQTRHDGSTVPVPKDQFTEGGSKPKSLIGPTGQSDAGRIVELIAN